MIEIRLEGNIPSKKNSRARTATGISVPNNKFIQWQNDAIKQVRIQTRERLLKPVKFECVVYFGTNIRADLDNRITSILDMLVEAIVLKDDKWQDVPLIIAQAEYRKRQPGAFIRLTELG